MFVRPPLSKSYCDREDNLQQFSKQTEYTRSVVWTINRTTPSFGRYSTVQLYFLSFFFLLSSLLSLISSLLSLLSLISSLPSLLSLSSLSHLQDSSLDLTKLMHRGVLLVFLSLTNSKPEIAINRPVNPQSSTQPHDQIGHWMKRHKLYLKTKLYSQLPTRVPNHILPGTNTKQFMIVFAIFEINSINKTFFWNVRRPNPQVSVFL